MKTLRPSPVSAITTFEPTELDMNFNSDPMRVGPVDSRFNSIASAIALPSRRGCVP
jgi:hypothetical protein